MTDQNINVKRERSTIVRVVHNRENPFVQLNKQALWDSNLSLKATGLWARCMSRPNDWRFSITELAGKCKEGRRAIDGAMQELIEHRYACRLEYSERADDGKFKTGGVEYVFFEFPASDEEIAEQLDLFKKSFRHCGFGDCRNGNCRNSKLLIQSSTEIDLKQIDIHPSNTPQTFDPERSSSHNAAIAAVSGVDLSKKSKKIKIEENFSSAVKQLAEKMLVIVRKNNPVYRPPPDLTGFLETVRLMLEKDQQDEEDLLKAFEWACEDNEKRGEFSGWRSVVCNNKRKGKPSNPAEIFSVHFATIYGQMSSKAVRKFAPSSNDEAAYAKMKEMSKRAL